MIVLLPTLESTLNNLVKIWKMKRDEINKQVQRIQSITSVLPDSNTISSVLSTASSISYAPIHTTSLPNLPMSDVGSLSSNNSSTSAILLNDEIPYKISVNISEWLRKKQEELGLANTDFRPDIDFRIDLNKRRDGAIMRCKFEVKCAVSQRKGTLVVRHSII